MPDNPGYPNHMDHARHQRFRRRDARFAKAPQAKWGCSMRNQQDRCQGVAYFHTEAQPDGTLTHHVTLVLDEAWYELIYTSGEAMKDIINNG